MRRMRGSARAVAVAAVTALALAAGGLIGTSESIASTPSASAHALSGSLKLIDFTPYQAPFTAAIAGFEKIYPGASIAPTYYEGPADYDSTLLTELAAGGGPDLFDALGGNAFPNAVGQLVAAGRLARPTSPWTTKLVAADSGPLKVGGKIYAWPYPVEYGGLWYNPKLLASLKLQVPTTYAAVLADCKKSAKKGIPFIAETLTPAEDLGLLTDTIAEFVQAKNPNWFAQLAAHKTTFSSSPLWHAAMQSLVTMAADHCFQPHPEAAQVTDMFALIAAKKAVGTVFPFNAYDAVKLLNPSIKLQMVAFPAVKANQTVWAASSEDGLAVNAKSSNKALASAFVNYLARPNVTTKFAALSSTLTPYQFTSGNLPSYLSGVVPLVKRHKVVEQVTTLIPNGPVFGAFTVGASSLVAGQTTVAKVLASMDAAMSSSGAGG